MLGFLRRLRRGQDSPVEDDPELQEEMNDALSRVKAAEEAGALPVLETQHRAIGQDICHLAVPASLPDRADAFGKLFVTNRRVVFAGPAAVNLGLGRIVKATRSERDVIVIAGGDDLQRFRCNSYGDAMIAVWMIDKLRGVGKGAS